MARKSNKPEEIIKLLALVEIEVGKGQTTGLALQATGLYRSKVIIAGARNTVVCKSTRQGD